MSGKIIPIQREHANKVFNSEWSHQLASIEQSVSFFEEHFMWSTGLLRSLEGDAAQASSEYGNFYEAEAPIVIKEARDALEVLKLLCRANPE